MLNILRNIDENLVRNKPEVWLSKVHYAWPAAVFVCAVVFFVGFHLPLTTNIVPFFFITCFFALVAYLYLLRQQSIYSDPVLRTKQLHRIFLLNFCTNFLIVLIAVAGPFILSSQVRSLLKNNFFIDDSEKIRIAMVKSEQIDLIKRHAMDKKYIDSVRESSWDDYIKLTYKINDIESNSFIKNSIGNLDLTMTTSSPVTTDTTLAPVDSMKVYGDSSSNASSFFQQQQNTKYEPYQYNDLEISIQFKTDQEIDEIKKNIRPLMAKYDFSIYDGSKDSTNDEINSYYKLLNQQSINLYKSQNLYSEPTLVLLLLVIISLVLSQVNMFALVRKHKIVAFISLASFVLVCSLPALFPESPEPIVLYITLFLCSGVFFILLLFSKKIFKIPFDQLLPLPLMYFLNLFSHIFIVTVDVLIIMLYDKVFESASDYNGVFIRELVLAVIVYFLLFFPINFQFIKGYHYAIKKPTK